MTLRPLGFTAIVIATAGALGSLLFAVLAPGGWTVVKALILACFALQAPWLGICLGNALPGLLILLLARQPARAVLPVAGDIEARPVQLMTAIAVTLRAEEMTLVLPPLRRLLDGLDAAGAGERFVLWLLSDTPAGALATAEESALAAFRAADARPARVHYRRRQNNAGLKAGNVMDFLDHHAGGCELALMLDADSAMSAGAVLRLVRIMQAAPRLGIVQHLTAGAPAEAAFARLFQFGMRAGMRVWATGQAWWQGDAGPYWGHNAVLRIAPFRAHCRLAPLPGGGPLLSHDQVEAARLRAAGWGVCVWADDDGSLEAHPPAMPEFLRRECRWLAGNMQYRHVIGAPGLRPMGRWQLLQAMLLFAGAPLSLAMLALATANVATGGAAACPRGRLAVLAVGWTLTLYAPKLFGYLELALDAERRAEYGGGAALARSAAAEFAFTLLLDAPAQFEKARALLWLARGRPAGWPGQNRRARAVGWGEAARLFWPHTGFGAAVFAVLLWAGPSAALWAAPFAGGLLTAIPFAVFTANARFSAWLRRKGVATMPEERPPPEPSAPATLRPAMDAEY